jgi:hypothetical protein
MGYVEKNLLPGEKVIYRAQLARLAAWARWAAIIAICFVGCLFLPLGLILVVPTIWGAWLASRRARNSEFAVTDRRLILHAAGGRNRSRSVDLLLEKIESITINRGRSDRTTTMVVTGSGGTREVFYSIADPETLRRHVYEQIEARRPKAQTA